VDPAVNTPPLTARRARGAVAVLFFTNGALFANVIPRYPELKAELGLSNAALGSAVAAYGLGALAVGMVAGVLVSRWGSARVAPVTTVAIAANLVGIGNGSLLDRTGHGLVHRRLPGRDRRRGEQLAWDAGGASLPPVNP
jgi:cyanate permease